jgi:putative oxidoreductase
MNTKQHDLGLLLLRLGTGGLMLFHGIHKLQHGHGGISATLEKAGLPDWLWIGVPISEVIAPIFLILGIFGKISALLIAVVMLFSIYLALGYEGFTLTAHGGLKSELNLLFMTAGIALFFTGSGKFALYKGNSPWLY